MNMYDVTIHCTLSRIPDGRILLVKPLVISQVNARNLGFIPTILRSVLKIRYLLLGGAIGGGASLAKVRCGQYKADECKFEIPYVAAI